MAHTYMLFDFGADESKAQQAWHKLETWKQAFRLDKKLQFKLDRGEEADAAVPEPEAKPKEKLKADKTKGAEGAGEKNGHVKLLVRLYFSAHEKLSEQRWLDRIPSEEPFKAAKPKVIRDGESDFAEILKQFDALN
jgi:hypothetical protein